MTTDSDLVRVVQEMRALEGSFIDSPTLGLHLSADDQAEFERLAAEAKTMLDSEIGFINGFSFGLFRAINSGSGNLYGGPSLALMKDARVIA